jgi:hypothetical protein
MPGEDVVLPEIEGGVTWPFRRIHGCVALALKFCGPAPFAALTVKFCGGGDWLLLVAAQKTNVVGVRLMVFWALAVSKVPNATSNTKAIKAMGLKGVFTDSSSESGSHRTGFSNLDAIT